MSEHDPAEQISDALARLRWRGGPMRPMLHGHRQDGHQHDGHPHEAHSHVGHHHGDGAHEGHGHDHGHLHARRGPGGPALRRLLWVLAASDVPLSVSDIAERIGVDQPRASRLVAQAVEFGFVRREADPEDARRIRIVPTGEGTEMANRLRGQRGEAVREALAGFSETEQQQLATLLERLADAWPSENVRGRL